MNKLNAIKLLSLALIAWFIFSVAPAAGQAPNGGVKAAQQQETPPPTPADLKTLLQAHYQGQAANRAPAGLEPPASLVKPAKLDIMPPYTVTLGAWHNLRPTENFLRSMSMLPPSYEVNCSDPDQKSKGWIVGDYGTILGYCNGVWEHAVTVESIPTHLYGVQAISPTLSVAVGQDGAVLLYLWDRIARDWVWTKSPIVVGNQLLYNVSMVKDPANPDPRCSSGECYSGWAVGAKDASGRGTLVQGTLFPTNAYSETTYTYEWRNVTDLYPDLPQVDFYFNVQMLAADDGWAVGGRDGVGVIIHWDGSQWREFQQAGSYTLLGLKMLSENDGWAVGAGGAIYHFDGQNWTQAASPTTGALVAVDFLPNGEGWAVGFSGELIRFDGQDWSTLGYEERTTDPFDFWDIDFTSGKGWISGFHAAAYIGGHILEYENNQWWAVSPPTDNRLNRLSVVSETDVWGVGAPDGQGGTIVHWDGRHWRRWYQHDLPIPGVELLALDMVSANDGWAAGDPPTAGAPAVFLYWDGYRWAPPRYNAPVNVRVNDLDMLDSNFGWAAANEGNAVAKYDGLTGYWSANHTYNGCYYQLFGTNVSPYTPSQDYPFDWEAWAVGYSINKDNPTCPAGGTSGFLRYDKVTPTSYAWNWYPYQPYPAPNNALLDMEIVGADQISTEIRGFAVGPGSVYAYDPVMYPDYSWYKDSAPGVTLHSVDIIKPWGVAWFGGANVSGPAIMYRDYTGNQYANFFHPFIGYDKGLKHRPIGSLKMASNTLGWAVGDPNSNFSVIYQYPFPNFTLQGQPASRAVMPGGSAAYTITLNALDGMTATVKLSAPPTLPGEITLQLITDTANSDHPGMLRASTTANTPSGVYNIPVTGVATYRSGDNTITVDRQLYLRLTVTLHPLDSVSPSRGPAGTILTLNGQNFGSDPGPGSRSYRLGQTIVNGVALVTSKETLLLPDASILSWSDTQIAAQVPDSTTLFPHGPVLGKVGVWVNTQDSNRDFEFQLENHLADIEVEAGSDAMTVTLTGTSLGLDPGYANRSTSLEHVSVNGTWVPYIDVLSWSNNRIVFRVAADTPRSTVRVTSNGYESNGLILVKTFNISGQVVDASQQGLAGVTVQSSAGSSTLTDASGMYTLTRLLVDSYIVTPNYSGYTFSPVTATVQITDQNIFHVDFTAYRLPVALFTASPTVGTPPLVVSFTNQSSGDIFNYLWDFGDGGFSSQANPSHTYAQGGSFTVTLTVGNPAGSAQMVRPAYITVYRPVQANFQGTPTSGTGSVTVQFTNLTTGDYTTLEWDFGDEQTSTEINPTHTYTQTGRYTVTLKASGLGGIDTEIKAQYITVYEPINADFSASPLNGPAPLTVRFTNNSTGDFTSCYWTFGDGQAGSSCMNVIHSYSTPDTYDVSLTVSGPAGNDTETKNAYIEVRQTNTYVLYLPLVRK